MEYNKLVAVTGLSGLFELVNTKSDGGIVRSLEDKKTQFVSSRIHHFTHLESIEIYTTGENVNLVDVFNAIDKDGGKLPDEKDAAAVKKYFEKVFPEMDFERVYNSDMKKIVKWFAILKKNNIEIKLSELPEEEEEVATQEEAPAKAEKPVKKAAKKVAEATTEKEEKPAKKATTKKTAKKEEGSDTEAAPKKATKKK